MTKYETIPKIVTNPKMAQAKLKFSALTGNSRGEKRTARRKAGKKEIKIQLVIAGSERMVSNSLFQTQAMTQKGIENRPFDHLALAKSPRVKMSLGEGSSPSAIIGIAENGLDSPQSGNESVSSDSRYTSTRNERSESDRGRKDSAKQDRCDDSDENDGVARLSILVDFADPRRSGKDTVTSDGEDESRSSSDCETRVL